MAQLEDLTGRLCYEYDASGMKAAMADMQKASSEMGAMGKAMGSTATASGKLGSETEAASKKFGRLKVSAKEATVSIGGVERSALKVGAALGAMGAGATLAIKGMVSASSEATKAMAEVGTISKDVAADIQGFKAKAVDLAATLGQDVVVATRAMYNAMSAGVQAGEGGDNIIEFMEVAGKAAIAGVTDINTATSALTVALNSYGKELTSGNAVEASDSLFTTVRLGVTTFGELGASLGKVTGIAANAGIPLDDLNAAIAQITTKGFNTAEAVTAVRGSIVALLKGTPGMSAALADMGYESGQAMLSALGYQGSLEALREYADRTGQSVIGLTGRVEGANAVFATTGENAEGARQKLDEYSKKAGAAGDAFGVMAETGAQKMAQFKETINGLKIGIGDALVPVVGVLVDMLQGLADGFNNLGPHAKTLVAVLLGLAAVVGTVGGGFLGLVALFGPFIISAGGVAGAFSMIAGSAMAAMSAIAPIALPLLAVGAAFALLKKNQDNFTASTNKIASGMSGTGASLNAYANAVRKAADEQTGLGGAITRSNLLTRENEVVAATDAYLRYGLQVNEAVLADKDFAGELKALQTAYKAGKVDMEGYEAGVQALANKYSMAAGAGVVLTDAQRKVRDEFSEFSDGLVDADSSLGKMLAREKNYADLKSTLADRVADGTVTQQQATAALRAYIDMRDEATRSDREAGNVITDATDMYRRYSDELSAVSGGMAIGFDPGDSLYADDEEALKEHFENVEKINEDANKGYYEWGANWFQLQDDYNRDMEEARRQDAENAAKAAREAAKQRDAVAQGQAGHAKKVQDLQEKIAKAQEKGDLIDVAAYQEQLGQVEAAWAEKGNIVITAMDSQAVEVQRRYEQERQAQVEHLAQMALDHLNQMLVAGEVSEERAQTIYGSIAAAFPGSELFSPANAAMMEFSANMGTALHDTTAAGETAARELGANILKIPEAMEESDAVAQGYKQRAVARWVAEAEAHGEMTEEIRANLIEQGLLQEETTEVSEETADRREDVSSQVIAYTDEELSAIATAHGGMRNEYGTTATTSTITGRQLQQDMSDVGTSAMGMGDNVETGAGRVKGALTSVRDASTGLGDDVAEGATTASSAWVTESEVIKTALADVGLLMDDQLVSQETLTTGAQTHATEAETAKKTEVEAHEEGAEAAQDHADDSEDAYERTEKAAKKAQGEIDEYSKAISRIPKTATTRFAVQNYDDTYNRVATLLNMIGQATGLFTFVIEGKYDPIGPGVPPGSPRFQLTDWVIELQARAAQGFTIPGRYDGEGGMAWRRGGLALNDALDDTIATMLDLERILESLTSGTLRQAWDDATAKAREFEQSLIDAGGALRDLTDEYTRFFTDDDDFSLSSMISELTRDLIGPDAWKDDFRKRVVGDLGEIQKALEAAMAAGDVDEMRYQWERMYKRIGELESERHEMAKNHLQDALDASDASQEQQDALKDRIDRLSARHEDFMRDLDLEQTKVENLQESYDHYAERVQEYWDAVEDARRAYLEALEDAEEELEDAEDRIHDQVMDYLDEQEQAIEDARDVEVEAWKRRADAAKAYHDGVMEAYADEEQAVKDRLDAEAAGIDAMTREIDALQKLPWADGTFGGRTLDDLRKMREESKRYLDDFTKAIDKLPKYDESKTGPRKKIETGIERAAVTDRVLLDALRAGMGSLTDPRLQGLAQEILAGGKVRADYVREVFAAIQTGIENAQKPLDDEISRREAIIGQKERELELAELTHAENKAAADEELAAIDRRKEAEAERYAQEAANIEAGRKAAEEYYDRQMDAIEAAREAEKKRHDDRLLQIAEAFVYEKMVAEGMTPEEARAELDRLATLASQIAAEARRIFEDVLLAGRVAADDAAWSRSRAITRRTGEIGAGGGARLPGPSPVSFGGRVGRPGRRFGTSDSTATIPMELTGNSVATIPDDMGMRIVQAIAAGLGTGSPVVQRVDELVDQGEAEARDRQEEKARRRGAPFKNWDAKRPFRIEEGGWTGIIPPPPTIGPVPYTGGDVKRPSGDAIDSWSGAVALLEGAMPPGVRGYGGGKTLGGASTMTLNNYGTINLDGQPASDFEEGILTYTGAMP